jgi:hypothetical protein
MASLARKDDDKDGEKPSAADKVYAIPIKCEGERL